MILVKDGHIMQASWVELLFITDREDPVLDQVRSSQNIYLFLVKNYT